jgi:hypothetical protein
MNIISPVDVAFGEGILLNVTEAAVRLFEKYHWTDFFDQCLTGPTAEPHYPVYPTSSSADKGPHAV